MPDWKSMAVDKNLHFHCDAIPEITIFFNDCCCLLWHFKTSYTIEETSKWLN